MMTTRHWDWIPFILLEIPEDIDPLSRPEIKGVIDEINQRLSSHRCMSKADALGIAAVVLSKSDCGACGRPQAKRKSA